MIFGSDEIFFEIKKSYQTNGRKSFSAELKFISLPA